eukprot:1498386-Rhodomonas_salina.2
MQWRRWRGGAGGRRSALSPLSRSIPLLAYAPPMPNPVLTSAIALCASYAVSVTDIVRSAITLRASYAMSDIAQCASRRCPSPPCYDPTRLLCDVRYSHSL